MRIVITTCLIILFFVNVKAQSGRFDSLITSGIHQIYNIKFNKAANTFSILKKDFPEKLAGIFFDTMIIWWKIMLNFDDESNDDLFYDKLDNIIDKCDEILDEDPRNVEALFFKGGALGFRGRLSSIRERWFDAALDGKDALPLVKEAYENDPKNVDVQLGFGIYNYYADVIPEIYPFVKPIMLFFPSGDKEKGVKQLINTAYNGKYAKIEARYFLMSLYYRYEKDYSSAIKYARMLTEDFPDNPTFQRYLGRINVRRGDYISASKIFRDVLGKCASGYPGYTDKVKREANYYLAMKYKNYNEPDSAKIFFKNCELISRKIDGDDEESGFLINSVLYLGMIYDQQGERENALRNYNEVLEMREFGNSHDIADKYLKSPYYR